MRKIYLMGVLLSSGLAFAQPVGSPPANNTNAQAAAAWYRGGNNPVGSAGTNNIFGTMWNSPIYTVTNGVTRTRLSGNLPAVPALGTTVNLTGHFGIGLNGYFNTLDNAPLTMLHLEGSNNTPFGNHFGGQYRTWMRVGAFMHENSDAMYVGMKPEGFNRSDAVVNWSDDNPFTHNRKTLAQKSLKPDKSHTDKTP